jgi:hypothetical protein
MRTVNLIGLGTIRVQFIPEIQNANKRHVNSPTSTALDKLRPVLQIFFIGMDYREFMKLPKYCSPCPDFFCRVLHLATQNLF